MPVGKKSQRREKSAMTVSLYGNLFFVIIELLMAIYTRSQAVLLDAVYDGVEFFMLLPSIFLIPLLYKPATETHPFGYMQLESVFVVVKGATMSAVTIGLIINNIDIMLHGGRVVSFSTVAYFELFACILGIAVSLYLRRKNRMMNSPLITMEMRGWQIDSIVSLGMTAAFFLPSFIDSSLMKSVTPYLDQLITVVLSLIMLPTPLKAVITGLRDLILIPPEEEIIDDIKETIDSILRAYGYEDLYYEIVRTGRKLWISTYIAFDKDMVSISRFQQLQDQCIKALSEKYADFQFELLPDIEMSSSAPSKE